MHTIRAFSLVCFVLLCLCACDDSLSVISPEDFQNIEQEDLGDQLWEALTSDEGPYEVLDKEENEILYEHLNKLYQQSYFLMRAKNGWSTNRDWRIAIFVDENQSAFTFPGGNMMISTGMLKTFRKEYELFYLLSFENALMNSGYLFSNFLTFIEDSIDVENLIDQANNEKALAIALEMADLLEFNEIISEEIDLATMEWICESSSFRVDGILSFFSRLNEDSQWLNSRMSSLNRLESVEENYLALDCDNGTRITSLGNDFYVNVILPLIP